MPARKASPTRRERLVGATPEPGRAAGSLPPGGVEVRGNQSPDTNNRAGYYRDPSGLVYLRGRTRRCGQANGAVFTLPLGYRPLRREQHVVRTDNPSDAPSKFGTATIDSDGSIGAGGTFGGRGRGLARRHSFPLRPLGTERLSVGREVSPCFAISRRGLRE